MAPELSSTPLQAMHRARTPLALDPTATGSRPPDGELEMRVVDGVSVPRLPCQPRGRRHHGVSLFVPECGREILVRAHNQLGDGCCTSTPSTPLPEGLKLVHDQTFSLWRPGERQSTVIGQHYTLFVADPEGMHPDAFRSKYEQLMCGFPACAVRAASTGKRPAATGSGAVNTWDGAPGTEAGAALGAGRGTWGEGPAGSGPGGSGSGEQGQQ
jgi:hypothetical protein